ncbi:hypothetical protein OXPF_25240 [Oxobacter pfennigii]|uniref:DHHW protein n=1 Tax=Oxobacter pfennigii TaxID=36849 RepID=A0A0P8W6M2_9CLOT|nr:DHHW family protein [Oxobacter pfennigii]KPU44354.1 hypothetical protein OXPF_25240 [Oxobacter pfennigii]
MRINNQKSSSIIQNIACMLPAVFILAMLVFHLALPDKTFSKEEKRYLTQWPAFHIEKVLDGSYETKFEAYFSDQFPFRNFWVNIQEGLN